jgi:hypothetical protein
MTMSGGRTQREALVLVGAQAGLTFIPTPTPLTRLHYFDGKFLRAADLQLEQDALRTLVALANQAGGAGVVHGLECTLAGGDRLHLGPGLAVDPAGRALLLPQGVELGLAALLEASRQQALAASAPASPGTAGFAECAVRAQASPAQPVEGTELYLIVLSHAEAFCGTEDVYGKLCEEACVTSTQRPFLVEGIAVRAVPLTLSTALARSTAVALTGVHLRSRVASAYFAGEAAQVASLISRDGLASGAWCLGAAALGGTGVPVAVLARSGGTTVFLDAWTARRERMEAPPRQYWAWRMAMRPWPAFLAQVLQFQCQLRSLFQAGGPVGEPDPCAEVRGVARDASAAVAELMDYYGTVSERLATFRSLAPTAAVAAELPALKGGLAGLKILKDRLEVAVQVPAQLGRVLIRGGIIELPPAGYLPVAPGSALTANQQVRQLLGEGVSLRFCVVRPDYVPHALEEAQHLERISLLEGLDDPRSKPEVDVLVPDGQIVSRELRRDGLGFEGELQVPLGTDQQAPVTFRGAGRAEVLPAGGGAFHFGGALSAQQAEGANRLADAIGTLHKAAAGHWTEVLHRFAREAAGAAAEVAAAEAALRVQPAARFQPGDIAGMVVAIPVGGAWVTARADRDPFDLGPGDTTPASLRLATTVPSSGLVYNDLEIHGTLRVDESSGGDADRVVLGRMTGAVVTRVRWSNQDPQVETQAVNLAARLRLRRALQGRWTFDARLDVSPSIAWVSRVAWSGSPVQVTATSELVIQLANQTLRRPFADAVLREKPDALAAGSAEHTLALWGLELLGSGLEDPRFPASASKSLFPPLPPPTEELEVRATRDWVLFHRRRPSTCAAAAPGPAPVPARRYQAQHLGVANEEEARAVRNALLAGASVGNLAWRPVSVVEFAPGVPALASDPALLARDWRAAGPGSSLLYAAIASEAAAAADGEVLALGRLGQLQKVLFSVTPADPALASEVLPRVPEALAVPGTDGTIVLLTRAAAQTTCQAVYRVENEDAFKFLSEMIRAGRLAEALQNDLLRPLGDVTFQAGTDQVPDQSLAAAAARWDEAGGGTPVHTAVVSGPGAPAQDRALHAQQAAKIQEALGGGPTPGPLDNPAALPGNCPSIALVVARRAELRVGRIYTWGGRDANKNRVVVQAGTNLQVRFQADGTLFQPLTDAQVSVLKSGGRYFQVELASAEGGSTPEAEARLKGIFQELAGKDLLSSGATANLTTLAAGEAGLLNRDGIVAQDVVLLRMG